MDKQTIKKFESAEPLSDQECYDLYMFFKRMEDPLMLMGERYHFAWWGVMMNRRAVENYIIARGLFLPKQ